MLVKLEHRPNAKSPMLVTPLSIMTHTHEPVPYMIYDSRVKQILNENATYCEEFAKESGKYMAKGHELIGHFINV